MNSLFIIVIFMNILFCMSAQPPQQKIYSYYGQYNVKAKKSGFPAKSLVGPVEEVIQKPVPKRKYHIGVLFPHMKDSYWLAAYNGITSYAKELGVEITIYTAGAYINFGKQKRQLFNLAKNNKVDGIILSVVDYKKMDKFVEEISHTGVPVIALINDIYSPAIKAKAMVSYYDAGYMAGEFVLKDSRDKDIKVAFLPGPKKSGWANDMYKGFVDAVAKLKKREQTITVLPPLYGDTRPQVQMLRLRILLNKKNNHAVDYVVANAVAAVEAVHYLKKNRKRHPNAKIVSTYLTASIYNYIRDGSIAAAPYDQTMVICQVALNMMVRLLNGEKAGKDFPFRAAPGYTLITPDNIKQYKYEELFGEKNSTFKPGSNK